MDEIVKDVLNSDYESEKELDSTDFDKFENVNISVIGCGGAGNNILNRLYDLGVDSAELIAIDTDKKHLNNIDANKKILLGSDTIGGLGSGGDIDQAKKASKKASDTIKEAIDKPDLVFVTGGLGGGTGTGISPIIGNIARNLEATVIGIFSMPFYSEQTRVQRSKSGVNELKNCVDSLILLDVNQLSNYIPNLPIDQTYSVMDQIISQTIKCICITITKPSLINIDYADIETIMDDSGISVLLVGETEDGNEMDVVDNALNQSLLDIDIQNAQGGGLIHITGDSELTLDQVNTISDEIVSEVSPDTNIIFGARIDDNFDKKARVISIITGFDDPDIFDYDYDKNKNEDVLSNEQIESSDRDIDTLE